MRSVSDGQVEKQVLEDKVHHVESPDDAQHEEGEQQADAVDGARQERDVDIGHVCRKPVEVEERRAAFKQEEVRAVVQNHGPHALQEDNAGRDAMDGEADSKVLDVPEAHDGVPEEVADGHGRDKRAVGRVSVDVVREVRVAKEQHRQQQDQRALHHGHDVDVKVDLGFGRQRFIAAPDPRRQGCRRQEDGVVEERGEQDFVDMGGQHGVAQVVCQRRDGVRERWDTEEGQRIVVGHQFVVPLGI